ncbi:MAG: hypothetical protein ABI844_03380 [Saprospiraceae bacterium]
MNKFLLPVIFIVAIYFAHSFLPWYGIAFFALLASLIGADKAWRSFIVYFILGFGLWFYLALGNDAKAASAMSSRIGVLFGIQSKAILMISTALIGGITAGLGGLTGSTFKAAISSEKK